MPALALAFALTAAVFHAVWNLLLARARDVEAATVVALLTAEVVFAPVAIVVWRAHEGVWPWLVGSGLFELAYFALLATAYRLAPLSVVYPVARGGAPVLVLAVSVVALGHSTSAHQVAGVALIVAGILLVRGLGRADARGLAFGIAIACCIAGYTLVDKHGITHAGPIPYLELSMLGPTVLYAGAVLRVKGGAAVRAAAGPATFTAGIATFVAYAFVLAALERASAASVAAVRETSVVVATALAAFVLKEHVSRWRFAGACVVVAGIVLLSA
ncbi:MAG TPA: DMT family transporter [Gaiellaceae bacterium]|jgi:drug/metabolite transporter (DMT)-like permease|nr:DMT family transporter [Gaiellaceae bacterium]